MVPPLITRFRLPQPLIVPVPIPVSIGVALIARRGVARVDVRARDRILTAYAIGMTVDACRRGRGVACVLGLRLAHGGVLRWYGRDDPAIPWCVAGFSTAATSACSEQASEEEEQDEENLRDELGRGV